MSKGSIGDSITAYNLSEFAMSWLLRYQYAASWSDIFFRALKSDPE